jgi:hypothetical protein
MEKLIEIAKIAEEKGFKPHSVSTNYTNKYLLGGKNFFINDTCMFLWLCEVQKWLRDIHNVDVEPYLVLMTSNDREIEQQPENKEYSYKLTIKGISQFVSGSKLASTYEKGLEIGIQETLKLI